MKQAGRFVNVYIPIRSGYGRNRKRAAVFPGGGFSELFFGGGLVYQWTQEGYLPHIKLSKCKTRWRRSALEEWLRQREHPGRDERVMG